MSQQAVTSFPWKRYFFMLVVGILLFIASVAALMHYVTSNRYDFVIKDAYDYHMLLQAQQAMDRLVYRLELASMDASSVAATETRPSLNDQLEIAWSRFNDLISSKNTERLRLIPGLSNFVKRVIETLKKLQESIQTPTPDYLAYLDQMHHLSLNFSRTFTSLPAHLLPIQKAQQEEMRYERYGYYAAIGFSSFIVLLLYGLAIRELFLTRRKLQDCVEKE